MTYHDSPSVSSSLKKPWMTNSFTLLRPISSNVWFVRAVNKAPTDKVAKDTSEQEAQENVVREEEAKKDLPPPPPEPTAPIEDNYPPQCSSEEVSVSSPVKQVDGNPSRSMTEEGEIHHSESSAHIEQNVEIANVFDPQVTEHTFEEIDLLSDSLSRDVLEKEEEKEVVEHSA